MLERDSHQSYSISHWQEKNNVHVQSENVNSIVYRVVSYLDEVTGPTVLQSQRATHYIYYTIYYIVTDQRHDATLRCFLPDTR